MAERQSVGTWSSRVLVWFFGALLSALFYWVLGFVLNDIGAIQGPDYAEIESIHVDANSIANAKSLSEQIVNSNRRIQTEKGRQSTLRDSTDSSQRTMNQLLELQRLSIQQGNAPNEKERTALVESEQLFLDNQREYQRLNQEIAQQEEIVRQLEVKKVEVDSILASQRTPAQEEYRKAFELHMLWIAGYKLAVLLPLLLVGVILYLKYRSGPYWAIIYAFGIAVIVKVGFVMHEYFPARYFKYVLIGTLLLVTLRILVYLLRSIAFPQPALLSKQYREAYESLLCPMCSYPIRRGPLKYMLWTKRTLRKVSIPISTEMPEEPYTCPSCATNLYAPCGSCGKIRPTLLSACPHCGAGAT